MSEDSKEKAVFTQKKIIMTVLLTYCALTAILLVGSAVLRYKEGGGSFLTLKL